MSAGADPVCPVPVALCLGGLDPSCGAGVVRDALTLASLGVHPLVVPTAETLQNGLACLAIAPPGLCPRQRFLALRPHLKGAWGVKLGLCAMDPGDLSRLLDDIEAQGPAIRLWDPILAPTAGVGHHDAASLGRQADAVLRHPGWVVAPNRLEAAALAGTPPGEGASRLAQPFLDRGAEAVWLKGGHAEGAWVEDLWVTRAGVTSLGVQPRLPGDRRGTGCTLGSAWVAYRLRGMGPEAAARAASGWLRGRWPGAITPGGEGRPVFPPEAS